MTTWFQSDHLVIGFSPTCPGKIASERRTAATGAAPTGAAPTGAATTGATPTSVTKSDGRSHHDDGPFQVRSAPLPAVSMLLESQLAREAAVVAGVGAGYGAVVGALIAEVDRYCNWQPTPLAALLADEPTDAPVRDRPFARIAAVEALLGSWHATFTVAGFYGIYVVESVLPDPGSAAVALAILLSCPVAGTVAASLLVIALDPPIGRVGPDRPRHLWRRQVAVWVRYLAAFVPLLGVAAAVSFVVAL